MPASIKLIVGLGNFTDEYAQTRHNAGQWLLEKLAEIHGLNFRTEKKLNCLVGNLNLAGQELKLAIPMSFMNTSGEAIQKLVHFYKIDPLSLLIAHDELDFPPGVVRLKFDGGSGGHNGLTDVIRCLNTKQFYRLRIGIGHPVSKDEVANFVLKKPLLAEKKLILEAIERVLAIVPDLVIGQIDRAMSLLNDN